MPFTDEARILERGQTRRKLQDAAARTPGGGGAWADAPVSATNEEGRSFGFRSGANRPGGAAERGYNLATMTGRELGEPTSFRGGAGAPEPIAVMRGMTTTYSPGRPAGRQFALPEVATPIQAQQSWNREQVNLATAAADRRGLTDPSIEGRFGGWRSPGQTIEEVRATKEGPGRTAWGIGTGELAREQAATIRAGRQKVESEQGPKEFQRWLHESPYSTFDTKTGKVSFVAKDEGMARDVQAAENLARTQGFEVGRQHFEDRQAARKWLQTQPLPADFDINAYLSAVSANPEAWAELMKRAGAAEIRPGPAPQRRWWEGRPPGQWGQLKDLLPSGEMETPPPF